MTIRILRHCVLIAVAAVSSQMPCKAQIRAKSGSIVVLAPQDLPEQAREDSEGFFIHTGSNGEFDLYVERHNGTGLSIFDISDPANIKFRSMSLLTAKGAFDFVGPEGENAQIIRFRGSNTTAILDVSKRREPKLINAPAIKSSNATLLSDKEKLPDTTTEQESLPHAVHDYDVVDTSVPDSPEHITTVTGVTHEVENHDTGTTFLLSSNGLTVIRRPVMEREYATRLLQQRSN